MYRSLLLNLETSHFHQTALVHFHQTVHMQSSHVVTFTHSTVQNGWTALQVASSEGHQKVVELLLGAGAKPDLQDKVRTGWDSA